jgi:hypothetical protein
VVKVHKAMHGLSVILHSTTWDRPPSHRPHERRDQDSTAT